MIWREVRGEWYLSVGRASQPVSLPDSLGRPSYSPLTTPKHLLDNSAAFDETARMLLFADNANVLQIVFIAATFIILIVAMIVFAILGKYLRLWIQSVSS